MKTISRVTLGLSNISVDIFKSLLFRVAIEKPPKNYCNYKSIK